MEQKFLPIDKAVFSSMYLVTADGRVLRKSDGFEYKSGIDNKGYMRVRLPYPCKDSNDGRRTFKIHRLVALFYLKNYSEDLQVNHKNGIKSDNRVENLEMVSCHENVFHAWNVLDSKSRREKLAERNRKNTNFVALAQSARLANMIPIVQLDTDGNEIATFDSMTDAANRFDNPSSAIVAISYAAKHDVKRYGYYWRYL